MTLFLFLAPVALAAGLSFLLTPLARVVALRVGAVDQPGPRKIHSIPTPRLGGLAVLISAGAAWWLVIRIGSPKTHTLAPELLMAIAMGLAPILLISIIDDIKPQRAALKFAAHLLGATIAVSHGVCLNSTIHFIGSEISIGWLAVPISILWLAGITSSFNLIDGLDGLSAGLALISSVSLAAVSVVANQHGMAAAASVLAGALLGFLPFNLYPAKIYLGDAGATFIGFVLGALTLNGGSTTSAGLAVTLPIVVLGIPLADTLLSMTRRLLTRLERRGGGIFEADHNHIHHRLLALGFDHKRAVLLLYGVGVLLALFGFASLFMTHQNSAMVLAALLIGAAVAISKLGYDEFAVVRSGAVLRVYDTPVLKRGFFVVFIDLMIIALSLYAAVGLKYDDWAVRSHREMVLGVAAILAATTVGMFALLRIYRRSWSNASIDDVAKLTTAIVTGSIVMFLIARFTVAEPPTATFAITYTLVMLVLAIGGRASYRVLLHWKRRSIQGGELVIIYGAGVGGALALREILTNREVPMKPLGFLDDDPHMQGRMVNGYPVLGRLEDLQSVVVGEKAQGVVIASEKIPISKIRIAKATCEALGAWTRVFSVNFRGVDTDPGLTPLRHEMPVMRQ